MAMYDIQHESKHAAARLDAKCVVDTLIRGSITTSSVRGSPGLLLLRGFPCVFKSLCETSLGMVQSTRCINIAMWQCTTAVPLPATRLASAAVQELGLQPLVHLRNPGHSLE
jgi:hypothetical protein